MGNTYTYLWEFKVSPEAMADFERYYGPDGAWVQLFRSCPDHIETLLLKDNSDTARFITVDRWRNEDAYLAFRSEFATQYARLGIECEQFTVDERSLGAFTELSPDGSFRTNPLRGTV